MSDSTKQFAPTPYHRQKARQEGRFAQSRDMIHAVILLSASGIFYCFGNHLLNSGTKRFVEYYSGNPWLEITPETFMETWNYWLYYFLCSFFPILVLILVSAVIFSLFQSGFLFLPQKILPDWKNIHPLTGTKRIFSWNSFIQLFLGLIKLTVLFGTAFWLISGKLPHFSRLSEMETALAVQQGTQILLSITLKLSLALFFLALLDYAWQKWCFEQELKMSLEELREEMKITEGNPEVRTKIHQKIITLKNISKVP
ncbi:MAG: EscU/YscU/HrcU family type III secretion system export apparatus switch protein [Planctomycetia bacterium]|nr:EscU/YscU/HrcU family type III secretion system export apparatus switch protein [Planctomycetia bacterium]